jgi:peptidoglycan hydrolase-like protein with peptidoglycan-binding domain
MRSADVRNLQQLLATKPDLYPECLVTGYFGALTKRAVQRFQFSNHIVSSVSDPGYGIVGPKTRAKLLEVFGN